MKLYKFRSLDNEKSYQYALDIIRNNMFYCAKFYEMNDPMEGVFFIYSQHPDERISQIYTEKNKYRICCFSTEEGFKNPAMWGYYTNGFKGIAIKIMVDINKKDNSGDQLFHRMDYLDSFEDRPLNGSDNKAITKQILTRKLSSWTHESEYRFLKYEENVTLNNTDCYEIGKITAVYFGNPYGDLNNTDQIQNDTKCLKEYMEYSDKLLTEIKQINAKNDEQRRISCYYVKIIGNKVDEGDEIDLN